MPKLKSPEDDFDDQKQKLPKGNESNNTATGTLNPPKVDDKTGKPTQEAITDFKQAHSIARNLYMRAREGRLKIGAIIAANYNGKSPLNKHELEKAGEAWKTNFSTNFISSIVDRVKPQFLDPIQSSDSITYSVLPEEYANSADKSAKFRQVITDLIRGWKGWTDFLNLLAQDVVMYGNAAPAWIDNDWRPRMWSYDHSFFPEGTWQHASRAQLGVFAQEMHLHEFLKLIENRDAAEDAGYDIEGCALAANEAAGIEAKGELSPMEMEDRVREMGTFGASYDSTAKNVDLYHVVVAEWDGSGVALWTVSQKTGHPIRHVEVLHDKMEDALTMFTLQTGNAKYYGSKGLGRLVVNLHIALEKLRCSALDQYHVSAMPIVLCKDTDVQKVLPSVRSPFVYLPGGVEVSTAGFEFNSENYMMLENKLTSIAESIAGAFIPPNMDEQGGSRTKIEAAQQAEREAAVRAGVLARWTGQFGDLVSALQRKICSPEIVKEALHVFKQKQAKQKKGIRLLAYKIGQWLQKVIGKDGMSEQMVEGASQTKVEDPEAVDAIVELLSFGLSPEEIGVLAMCPAGLSEEDNSDAADQKTIAFIQQKIQEQSPYFDQKKMAATQAGIMIGKDRAQQILQPAAMDPSQQANAVFKQTTEDGFLIKGTPMPVAGDDLHAAHRQVMLPKIQAIFQMLGQNLNPQLVTAASLMLAHYVSHLAQDKQTEPAQKLQEEQQVKTWDQILKKAEAVLAAQQKKQAQQGANGQPTLNGAPAQSPNGAPGAPPPNGPMAPDPHELTSLMADIAMHKDNVNLKQQDIDLRKAEFEHKAQMDVADHSMDAQKTIAQESAKAQQQGMSDAANEQPVADAAQQAAAPTGAE